MLNKIIYPKLSYIITGLCFQTQNELGRFAKEKQYADRLEQLLTKTKIEYCREARIPFRVPGAEIQGNIADFIVETKIVIDCKAKPYITKSDYYQMQRYLKATKLSLGLIINFRSQYLKPHRVLNYSPNHS